VKWVRITRHSIHCSKFGPLWHRNVVVDVDGEDLGDKEANRVLESAAIGDKVAQVDPPKVTNPTMPPSLPMSLCLIAPKYNRVKH